MGTEAASMWEREEGFSERFGGFAMQNSAVAPSENQSFNPKTASPKLYPVTPAPNPKTVPENSCPGIALDRGAPSAKWREVDQSFSVGVTPTA